MQWIIAGYTLAFALALITGGRLGDVYGRRRMFLVGVAGFTLASARLRARLERGRARRCPRHPGRLGGADGPAGALDDPRHLPARGAAEGLRPLRRGRWDRDRQRADPRRSARQGDLFGLDWRPIFLINLPVGLVTFAAALAFVRESRESDAPRLDLTGVGLVTAALLLLLSPALLLPLVQGALLAAVEHAGDAFSSWWLVPALLLSGLAMGMVAPTLVDVTLAGVHGRDAGSASGVLNTALQLGGAIGVALIGVVYFGALDEQGFIGALDDALWFQVGVFVVSALAMLLLPRRASADRDEAAVHATPAAAESC